MRGRTPPRPTVAQRSELVSRSPDAAARDVARALVGKPPRLVAASGKRFARTLAMGDPQASFDRVLEILAQHEALGGDGMLADDVALISMGDHFDWGRPAERALAAADGEQLLHWLAAHPPDQVHLLAGNHDLARVGELWDVSDQSFADALRLADLSYKQSNAAATEAFHAAHPRWFSDEMVARDLSTFRATQRTLVSELLRSRRMKAALALGGALFVHAGVTRHELETLGLDERAGAEAVAGALNDRMHAAADALDERPLALEGLHRPGDAAQEGGGMFYHRPSLGDGDDAHRLTEPRPRRRFHPDQLPRGLVQVVGHVRDDKCRAELARWCDAAPKTDGPIRHLVVESGSGRYAHGAPLAVGEQAAVMIFIDNGMKYVEEPHQYQLLDAARRIPASRGR